MRLVENIGPPAARDNVEAEEDQVKSFRNRSKAFLASWGRDLVLAGGGALTGIAVAFALGVGIEREPQTASAPPQVEPAAGGMGTAAASTPRRATPREATPWLPDDRLHETNAWDGAPVPGQPAWRKFAALAEAPEGRPMIAVIIDDMGVDRGRSARAIRLPAAVTLSFLPYASGLTRQVEAARRLGHELMVHLPMEPEGTGVDPGPNVLRVGDRPEKLRRHLDTALASFSGYVGLNNHMGSLFTADAPAMRRLLEAVNARGLLFVDSRTTAKTVGPEVARALGVPFAERDVFLDDDPSAPAVIAELRRVEEVARRNGSAIAIGHPRDATLDALEGWLWGLNRRGFALVPVSAIVKYRRDAG